LSVSCLITEVVESTAAHNHWSKDIELLITESNPKLLDTFADLTLTIERGEIESRASN
jgi:hypothetical protein